MEPEEIELDDLSRPEEQDDEEYETPFDWGPEFDRFMKDGPKQFYGVDPVNYSYDTVHARSQKQYEVKQEILFKRFGETFDRSFSDEQTYFMNKVKRVAEDIGPNQFVKYLEYEGKRVASYEGERYRFTGDYKKFAQDGLKAQDVFSNTPLGRYRDYLREEQGLMHLTPEKLQELYDYRRTEKSWVKFRRTGLFDALDDGEVVINTFGPTSPEALEKFKTWAHRYLPGISGFGITLATIVTAVTVSLKKGGRSVTKTIAKEKGPITKTISNSPATVLAPAVRLAANVTEETTGFATDNLWVLVVVPIVGYFLYKNGIRRTKGDGSPGA